MRRTRSRAVPLNRIFSGQALRDDSRGELVDDTLNVILTMLLVRIPVFAVFSRPDPVQKHHGMTEEARKRDRP